MHFSRKLLAKFHHPPPPTMSASSPLSPSVPSHGDGLSLANLKVVFKIVGFLTVIVLLIVTIYNCTRSMNASNDGVQTIAAPTPSTLPGDKLCSNQMHFPRKLLAKFHHPPPSTMSASSPLSPSVPSHGDGLSLANLKVVSEIVGFLTGIVLLIVTIYNCTRSRNASNDGVQTIAAPTPSTLPGDNDAATTKETNQE